MMGILSLAKGHTICRFEARPPGKAIPRSDATARPSSNK